jgi:hypothetical protein
LHIIPKAVSHPDWQMSAIRKIKGALDLKLKMGGEVVMEVCSQVMAERSEYFKALLAHDMAEHTNMTVDLTAMCRERSLLPVDIEWVVGSVENGRALPLPEDGGDEETPVLIRLLRATNYFGTWGRALRRMAPVAIMISVYWAAWWWLGVGFLRSHVEGLVSEGLTAEGVMDVVQEAKACDDLEMVESCKAFIRAHASEVGPPAPYRIYVVESQPVPVNALCAVVDRCRAVCG